MILETKEMTKEQAFQNILFMYENFFKGSPKECEGMAQAIRIIHNELFPVKPVEESAKIEGSPVA